MGCMKGLTVTDCTRCPALVESRSRIVNGVGPSDADLLFVGEAPGEQEDAEGEPFVGRSGAILDDVLRQAGLSRADVRITNCIRCRPPGNRDPSKEELSNCQSYLEQEIHRVDPVVIMTLGKIASEHLLGRPVSVTREAGTLESLILAGGYRQVLVSVHPAASLYDPTQRETLERTISKAANLLETGDQTTLGDY